MQGVNSGKDSSSAKVLRVLARTTGGAVGLVAGGMILGWLPVLILFGGHLVVAADSASFIPCFTLGFLVGAMFGVVSGTTIVNKALKERASFREAFVGGLVGLTAGALLEVLFNVPLVHNSWDPGLYFTLNGVVLYAPILAGGVIGSGWKAKPTDRR